MKTYKKYDMAKAGKSIDEILWHLEELVNCPENKDGELQADYDALNSLKEKVDTLTTYLGDIHFKK
jgi:hypothetical protein